MKILSIETSCDETAAAVVENKRGEFNACSNVVSSQIKIHAQYGGIVPEVAARLHIEKIILIINQTLKDAKMTLDNIDYIAVCAGPGLISSLMVGVETAKALAFACKKPLIKINHLEGHLLSFLSDKTPARQIRFPAIGLVVSGGHTQLILVKNYLDYKLIGETCDDAAGETFDKAAKILGLGYPGGPAISACAEKVQSSPFENLRVTKDAFFVMLRLSKHDKKRITDYGLRISLPRPMLHSNDFDFSFAGLKTAVLYAWNDFQKRRKATELSRLRPLMAKEIQQAIIDVLIAKTLKAATKFKAKTIILGGGVTANEELRRQFIKKTDLKKIKLVLPSIPMTGDNAVMIGVAAHFHAKAKNFVSPFKLRANPEWELT
ncbi:tRNA (adenosine(37)-N6)-threonylcarbamoyltransferase complex transferase subunit TsaD [Candidatus Falkowbacteria bacterium]|nr:tRNA (adenosine(37)-N6)-threonylcarbamoyltransferase complex transferase subunit TsaD [Candidatus Falkowbacteria bacterium]